MFLKGGRREPSSAICFLPGCKWSGISGSSPTAFIWVYKLFVISYSLLISYCRFITKSFMPSHPWQTLALAFAYATAAWWAAWISFCYSLKDLLSFMFESRSLNSSDSLPPAPGRLAMSALLGSRVGAFATTEISVSCMFVTYIAWFVNNWFRWNLCCCCSCHHQSATCCCRCKRVAEVEIPNYSHLWWLSSFHLQVCRLSYCYVPLASIGNCSARRKVSSLFVNAFWKSYDDIVSVELYDFYFN